MIRKDRRAEGKAASGNSIPVGLARVLRFAVVGIIATATYFFAAIFAGQFFSPHAANVIGWSVSVVVSYLGQNYFTFRAAGQHRRFAPRFVIATGTLFSLSCLVTYVGSELVGLRQPLVVGIVSLIYPASSFLIHMGWTFVDRRTGQRS